MTPIFMSTSKGKITLTQTQYKRRIDQAFNRGYARRHYLEGARIRGLRQAVKLLDASKKSNPSAR